MRMYDGLNRRASARPWLMSGCSRGGGSGGGGGITSVWGTGGLGHAEGVPSSTPEVHLGPCRPSRVEPKLQRQSKVRLPTSNSRRTVIRTSLVQTARS